MSLSAELLARVSTLLGKRDLSQAEFSAWFGGAADGGPAGDGMFPLTDSTGFTRMVPSPAKQMAQVGAGQQFTVESVLALLEANDSDVDPSTAASNATGVEVVGVHDGELKRFSTNLFASRRTADLHDLNDARVDDMIGVLRGGVEGKVNLGAIASIVNNLTINLASPPYNVVPDYQELRDGITTANSDLLDSAAGRFRPEDVGKMLLVSNALLTGGGPIATTIIEYISPTRVRMAHSATRSFVNNRFGWGTDNTAGVRLAAADSESPPGADYTFGKTVVVPAGGILTRPFRIRARTTWFGYGDRQSYFVKAPALVGGIGLDGKGVPFIRNLVVANNTTAPDGRFYRYADDFINLLNIGIHGGRYFQPGGDVVPAFELMSTGGTQPLAQVDPFWRIAFLTVWDSPGTGIHTFGRSSSNIGFVNVLSANGIGWLCESYDDNVNTVVVQANGQCGLYLGPNGGSNSNFTTIKSSYNGAATIGNRLGTNLTIDGSGFTLTGFRIQESNNSNVLIRGSRNQLLDGSIEDTGCITPGHGGAVAPEALRAGILFSNGATQAGGSQRLFAHGNKVANVQIGPAVHNQDAQQYASHAVVFAGNATYGGPQYNEVSISAAKPFARINQDGTFTPWGWRDWGAGSGVTGKDQYSSYNANQISVSGVAITD